MRSLVALSALSVVASAQADILYGLTVDNTLLRFDSATPGTVNVLGAIGGLQSGEELLGIDFRPANGALYGIGSTGRLYTIDFGIPGAVTATSFAQVPLNGTGIGIDVNPVADALRIVTDTGQNLRYRFSDGTLFTDTNLSYSGGGGTPQGTATAYTNNDNNPATGTQQYTIDSSTGNLYLQNPPNGGVLNNVGPLGLPAGRINGFDISGTSGTAFLGLNTVDSGFLTSDLFTVNLATGAATRIGSIGGGEALRGITAAPVPEPATMIVLGAGALALLRRRRAQ